MTSAPLQEYCRCLACVIWTLVPSLSADAAAPKASVNVNLNVSTIVIGQATWYRGGGDLRCGGSRPPSKDESVGAVPLNDTFTFAGGFEGNGRSQKEIVQRLTFKGHELVARSWKVDLATERVDDTIRFTLRISDALDPTGVAFDDGGDCGHTAGKMRLASDQLAGSIDLHLAAIEPGTAYSIDVSEATGLFKAVKPDLFGASHSQFPRRSTPTIAWSKGQPLDLTFPIRVSLGATPEAGYESNLKINIRPLGFAKPDLGALARSLATMNRNSTGISNPSEVVTLIDTFLSASRDEDAMTALIDGGSFRLLFDALDDLFKFEVWPTPGDLGITRDLKVSARLLGFRLGKRLLRELLPYCSSSAIILAPSSKGVESSLIRSLSTVSSDAVDEIARFPLVDIRSLADPKAVSQQARRRVSDYFAQHPEGLRLALRNLAAVAAFLPRGLVSKEVDRVVAALAKAADRQDELLKLFADRLLKNDSVSAAVSMSVAVKLGEDVGLANDALRQIQPVVSIRSNDSRGFVGRLFVTDAHLVRLVQSDVDAYLAAVRLAYLQPSEMSDELAAAERCLTSF